ncbi:DUF4188 domain-containing protein [Planctomonas sp. JC2975]|uniref:DUF4188 domain-containing protein n=1 Tax=Planctomonas sp. JC2975 TaxID=2729626 RepID=UPI001473C40A|nr:DUF4188 domain-containing protein [Planctomonas sp. JC2975]NNC12567.1 DUF4188 domain-containing protein [Planctomonas sp. JC2975]
MSSEVIPGRYTARVEGESITVFLIGMRANRWWRMGRVMRVASRMPPMLRYLATNPDAGLLGFEQWFGRTTIIVSYWRSPEHLQRFAADRDAPHLQPWREFQRGFSGTGDVGVWHETYQVPSVDSEAVYSDMPVFGLAKATAHERIGVGKNTARQRMHR